MFTRKKSSEGTASSSEYYLLTASEVADRLGVALSTLNGWLRDDEQRPEPLQVFSFHRYRGRSRFWSEGSFQRLEYAIHQESRFGALRPQPKKTAPSSEADPDAEDALARVIGKRQLRTY